MEFIKRVLDTNINPKPIVMLIIALIFINSLFFAVFADNLNSSNDTKPLASRSNEVIGRLIGPGNYTGTVDANTNPVDFFTIYLNGSTMVTDLINIYVETLSPRFGLIEFYNPDMFSIDWDFFSGITGQAHLSRRAITSAYHYIAVASPFMGTINYWLNISVRKSTNPQNDNNNDFANCTVAVNDDSFNEYMNYSYDYWDLYRITVPPYRNLTVRAEPSGMFDIGMQLYNAPDSSSDHIIMENDTGFNGEPEEVYFETNVSAFTVYIRIYPWWDMEETGYYWLNFSIIEPNSGPRINLSDPKSSLWTSSQGIEINEDESSIGEVNLSHHFMDDGHPMDPGKLTFNYSSNEDNISVYIAPDNKVTFAPAPNWFGSGIVTFFANDTKYNVSDEVNITVLPVNDPPVLDSIPNQVWTQDTPVLVELNISDIDSTEFTITDNSTLFNVNQVNQTITFTPTNAQVGTYHINITVSDGELNDSKHFSAQIANINDPPAFVRVGGKNPVLDGDVEFVVKEDKWNNFTVEVGDIDHDIGVMDIFKFSVNTTDPAFKIDSKTGNISFFPLQEHVGIFKVMINVSDGNGGLAEQNLSFTVQNVNDAPGKPEIILVNKSNLTIRCSVDEVFDEDGDNLTYSWTFGDEGDSGIIVLGRNVNHTYEEPGKYLVRVTVNDGYSGITMDSLVVNVTRPGTGPDGNDTDGNDTDGNDTKPFIDTDDDGLDDLWELENFGDLNQTATSDFDEDGFTDLQEFENKTNPKDNKDTPKKDGDGKDDDSDSQQGFSLPSGPEMFMYITGIIAIINLILIIIIFSFLMMRKKRGKEVEGADTRAAWPEEDRFTIPCPECGQLVEENARECPYCGEQIDLSERAEDWEEEEWEESEGRGRRRGRPRGAEARGARRERGREPEYDEEETEWEPEEEEEWEEEEYYDEEEPEEEEEWDEEEYYDEDEEAADEEWDEEEYYDEDEEAADEDWDEQYREENYDDRRYQDDRYHKDDRYYEDNYRPSSAWGKHEEKPAWDSNKVRRGFRR